MADPSNPGTLPPSGPLHVGQMNLPDWDDFRRGVEGIFERQYYSNHGPLERELDSELARYLGVPHAISVVNGTMALAIMLRAFDLKGAVIVPSFTFVGTVQAVAWAGLEPRFCDVDPQTHTLTAALVEPMLDESVAAILGVHLWGQLCDPDNLERLAARARIPLLFDAAHAIGCTAADGRRAGGFGDAEAFSFHATKILSAAEGGCITVRDSDLLAARMRRMRSFHAADVAGEPLVRMNAKMSELQALMALLGLQALPGYIEDNRRRYRRYQERLADIGGLSFIDHAAGQAASNCQYVVVAIDEARFGHGRDAVCARLEARGVLARDYFNPPVHRMAPFAYAATGELPATDHLARSLLQLPSGQQVTDEDIDFVCGLLRDMAESGDA